MSPQPHGKANREQIVLDVLADMEGWVNTRYVTFMARSRGLHVAAGGTRSILERLAEEGRCEKRAGSGNEVAWKAIP